MTKLFSDSLEQKISVRQRMKLLLQVMMCGMCLRFPSNIIEIRKRVRGSKVFLEQADVATAVLPSATKTRFDEVIKRQLD